MGKKKNELLKVGMPVVCARESRHGAIGLVCDVRENGFRVEWVLSPDGVPYSEADTRTSRYALTALAPRALDVLDDVPVRKQGFAFLFPLEGIADVGAMIEAHRIDAMQSKLDVTENFHMIAGVHGDRRYKANLSGCPEAPPLKKYLGDEGFNEAVEDAQDMAAKYGNRYVVLSVSAVIGAPETEEVRKAVPVSYKGGPAQLENKG